MRLVSNAGVYQTLGLNPATRAGVGGNSNYLVRVSHKRDTVGPRVGRIKREVLKAYGQAIDNSSGSKRRRLSAAAYQLRNNWVYFRLDGHPDFRYCSDGYWGYTTWDGDMILCRRATYGPVYELAATIAHEPVHRIPRYKDESSARAVEKEVMQYWRKAPSAKTPEQSKGSSPALKAMVAAKDPNSSESDLLKAFTIEPDYFAIALILKRKDLSGEFLHKVAQIGIDVTGHDPYALRVALISHPSILDKTRRLLAGKGKEWRGLVHAYAGVGRQALSGS